MCDFPSWIIGSDGRNYFLTDKDVQVLIDNGCIISFQDGVGHSAIEKLLCVKEGLHIEDLHNHPPIELLNAMRRGDMNKMAQAFYEADVTFVWDGVHEFTDETIVVMGGFVTAKGKSRVFCYNNSSVKSHDNSSVESYNNSSVKSHENSSVESYNNSSVKSNHNSSVESHDNSSVESYNNSSVKSYGKSSVESYDNSSVESYDNSSVESYHNSSVKSHDNSSVESYGKSKHTNHEQIHP
jgi:hypothetical protein